MVYKIEVVEQDVRIAIDENKTSEQLISDEDIDTLSLNEVIRSKIEEAVRRVETSAPVYLLEEGHEFGEAVYWEDNGSGWVLLPDDFMRLIAFRMSDWAQHRSTERTEAHPHSRRSNRAYLTLLMKRCSP